MDYCFVDCIGRNSHSCGYVEFLRMNERIQRLREWYGYIKLEIRMFFWDLMK